MTPEEIAQAEARCKALKYDNGVWSYDAGPRMVFGCRPGGMDNRICDIRGWGSLTGVGGFHLSDTEAAAVQDARGTFIAHARTDLPAALAEIRRLRKLLEERNRK